MLDIIWASYLYRKYDTLLPFWNCIKKEKKKRTIVAFGQWLFQFYCKVDSMKGDTALSIVFAWLPGKVSSIAWNHRSTFFFYSSGLKKFSLFLMACPLIGYRYFRDTKPVDLLGPYGFPVAFKRAISNHFSKTKLLLFDIYFIAFNSSNK